MRLLPIGFSVFCLMACLPSEPSRESTETPGEAANPPHYGRELGTLTALYPEPRADGGYDLELRFTRDTVLVDYADLRAYASDSLGRALFQSTQEPFYTRDGSCFFSPRKDACLAFRKAGDGKPDTSAPSP